MRSTVLRMIVHRLITYPVLVPIICAYTLSKNERGRAKYVDVFYSVRSFFHGHSYGKQIRVARYHGMNIIFPSQEDFCFDDVWLRDVYHVYQPAPEDVVLDVGAHMGFFTLKIARYVKNVIAFEPDPHNLMFLLWNIRNNNLSNVSAFNYALGDRDCGIFLKRKDAGGRTEIAEDNTALQSKMKTLDVFVKEHKLAPTAIKIDTEGYEAKVLLGARSTLTLFRPKLVIACYHYPKESEEVAAYLSILGYTCYVYRVSLFLQKAKETYIYAEFKRKNE